MKILVLVHAPRNAPRSETLLDDGLGPDDLAAIHIGHALQQATDGELVAVMAGPPSFDPVLQLAINAGATSGKRVWSTHLRDDHNIYAVSRLLAQAVSQIGFDLLLAGYRSTNWGSGMLGPAIAYQLGVPLVGQTTRLEIVKTQQEGKHLLELDRLYGSQQLRLRLPTPALITITSDPSQQPPVTTQTGDEPQKPQVHDLGERTPTTPTMRFTSTVLPATRRVEMLPDAAALLSKLRRLGIIR